MLGRGEGEGGMGRTNDTGELINLALSAAKCAEL